MNKAPQTPKGFRDILPELARKRREAINQIVSVLEANQFTPIETPTIEFAQTLTGKYGEEEKLIYQFKDRGERELALRYDLTVPLARFVATYQHQLKFPFRRYQVGQVFRGENPQYGRYREFTQLDFDSVGSASLEEDINIISATIKAAREIGLHNACMLINHRSHFANVPIDVIRVFDKLHKIGRDGVEKELGKNGLFSQGEIRKFDYLYDDGRKEITVGKLFKQLKNKGLKENIDFKFDPTLARGLDYYTGAIFELKPTKEPKSLSIGAGGRYDNLIGVFANKPIPAVGFSFGLDRLIEAIP